MGLKSVLEWNMNASIGTFDIQRIEVWLDANEIDRTSFEQATLKHQGIVDEDVSAIYVS